MARAGMCFMATSSMQPIGLIFGRMSRNLSKMAGFGASSRESANSEKLVFRQIANFF
jgi:hypothetical protein